MTTNEQNNEQDIIFSFFGTPKTKPGQEKPVSPGLLKFYHDLCIQKRCTPVEGVEAMNASTVKDMVDALKLYYPPSDNQLKIINDKITLLAENGVTVVIPPDLTGGFNGTASTFIQQLFDLEKKHVVVRPSIQQLQFVVSMFPCTQVDFESEGISRKVDLEEGLWRHKTPEEFANDIHNHFTKTELSAFINKWRNNFNEWKNTRIRPGQLNHIKTLLERTGSQIDEIVLMSMSQNEAAAYIEQLLNEAKRPLTSVPQEPTQDDLPINMTNPADVMKSAEEKLSNTIYRLIAETGVEPLVEVDYLIANHKELEKYLLYLVQECYIEAEEMVLIFEDNELLQEIFKHKIA